MNVRQATPKDYQQLVKMYKEFFPIHNVFQRPPQEVQSYLMNQGLKYGLYIAEDEGEIKAAVVLVKRYTTPDGSHSVFKLRHFAFATENAGESLLAFAEKQIKSKTAKIEVTLADNEEGMQFYRKHGFQLEGTLKNHYRWGESCLAFGKSLE